VVVTLAAGIAIGVNLVGDGERQAATTTTITATTEPDAAPLVYTTEELVAEFSSAVWMVESDGCGEVWTGTAWAIDDRHLVTNHHVVANSTRPDLVSRDGDRLTGRVIGWSERPDVAVIRSDTPLAQWLEWAPTDELREGQTLVALGYPVPDTVFTATPGSIMSFQSRTGVREAIRTNAALDRGNSGGPALDSRGRVIGVVTEMAPNFGGFQLVPLVFTADALAELVDDFLASPAEPAVDCAGTGWSGPFDPDGADPDTWSSGAETYGDHPALDGLWDLCAEGDFESCDDLWWMAPPGSDYERFGDTCGDRNRPAGWCTEIHGS
jgi:S1-C subfamily serine protease